MTLGVGCLTKVGEEPQGEQPCSLGGESGEMAGRRKNSVVGRDNDPEVWEKTLGW